MKYKLHIAVGQFEFVETESETVDEARQDYNEVKRAFESKAGLDVKTFNSAIDKYLTTKTMEADNWTDMSDDQKEIIQNIKRAFARIDNKNQNV